MLGDVSTTKVDSSCRVLNRETFVDSTSMTASITNVENDTRDETTSVQTQYTWGMEEELGYLEVFKEHLRSFDPIADRVIGWLSQQHRVFSRIDFEFFKDMSPDSFHIIPILYHAMLHRVLQLQNALEFIL